MEQAGGRGAAEDDTGEGKGEERSWLIRGGHSSLVGSPSFRRRWRVFGQNEGYDPQRDAWEQYAPMPTPRHGLGAAVIGDAIYVAGGGVVMGGDVQSAVHEAFTLAQP